MLRDENVSNASLNFEDDGAYGDLCSVSLDS